MKTRLPTKRLVAALLGPGLFMLAVDSGISHFAGKDMENGLQIVPVTFGGLGGVMLLLLGIRPLKPSAQAVSNVLRVVGGLAIAIGLAGTVLHLLPLYRDMSDESLTWGALEGAVSLSPPVFAPLGYAGLGALLIAIGSPRVLIELVGGAKAADLQQGGSKEVTQAKTG
ncbi:MAG: hypothetical protein ACT4TC_13750 [Myxococcaceae bacterium]